MESLKGFVVCAATAALSYGGYSIRTSTNGITQELGALAEVAGHLVTCVFYGDAAINELKHAVHGELTARLNDAIIPNNKPGEAAFYIDLPTFGEKITETTILRDVTRPFAVNRVHQAYPEIFDKWGSIVEYPKSILPAVDGIGLIPGIAIYVFSDVNGWSKDVGGDTFVGKGYRYAVPLWQAFYNAYIYVREVESVNDFISHDAPSPLTEYVMNVTDYDITQLIGSISDTFD